MVDALYDEMRKRATALPDPTAPQPRQTASEDKIRDRIRAILQRPRLQALRHALSQQNGGAQPDILLPPVVPLMQAIPHLYRATQDCLAELAESRPDLIEPTKTGAAEILGLLVLLAVQRERASQIPLDPLAGGLEIAIPLATEAGAEVLLSWRHDRAATFELRYDQRYGEQPVGLGRLGPYGLEHGIGSRDPLHDMLAGIWIQLRKADRPPPDFDEPHLQMLRAAISILRDFDGVFCYLTAPPDHSHSPLSDATLQRRLSAALPDLRIIRLTGAQGESLLVLDEYTLESAITHFLIMLRDAP